MAKLTPIAGAIVFGCLLLPNLGQGATDDVAALRSELEALKTDYTPRRQAPAHRLVIPGAGRPGRGASRIALRPTASPASSRLPRAKALARPASAWAKRS